MATISGGGGREDFPPFWVIEEEEGGRGMSRSRCVVKRWVTWWDCWDVGESLRRLVGGRGRGVGIEVGPGSDIWGLSRGYFG